PRLSASVASAPPTSAPKVPVTVRVEFAAESEVVATPPSVVFPAVFVKYESCDTAMEDVVAIANGLFTVSEPPTSAPVPESAMPSPAVGAVVATEERPVVPFPYRSCEEVKVVLPVPPFATGKVPETAEARATLPQLGATPTPPEMRTFPVATSASLESVVEFEAYSMSPVV